jgi:hypothetical protein
MSQETLEGILDVNDPVGSLLQVVLPIAQYVEEGMLPLRGIWSRPDGSGSP